MGPPAEICLSPNIVSESCCTQLLLWELFDSSKVVETTLYLVTSENKIIFGMDQLLAKYIGCLLFRQKLWKISVESQIQQRFSGKSILKLRTASRGSHLFLFGTEQQKSPCHLLNSSDSSLSSAKNSYRKSNGNGKSHLIYLVYWYWKNPYHYSPVILTGLFWQMVSTHFVQ